VDRRVFEQRRRRVMAAIGADGVAIFPAAPERARSNDVEYRYRQHSDFYYLTGFAEPGAVCVLQPGHEKEEYVLFVRPSDREKETWTGRRAGVEGAVTEYGASMAYPIEELDQRLPPMLAARDHFYYAIDRDQAFNRRVLGWLEHSVLTRPRSGHGASGILDARAIVHELRLHKESPELDAMRRAAAISADAHLAAMRETRPGRWEYEIEALIDYIFRRNAAAGPAYPSIVAAGDNATILHYTTNDRQLQASDLLLIDAGAEYDFYCADVTRTFPVGPRFEGRQKAIYELVLAAQLAAIEAIRPGAAFDEPHKRAVRTLVDGLLALGVLTGSADEIIEKETYKPVYMHRTSHWLGMDVHDVGLYKQGDTARTLAPGMVLTVEPGLYIGAHLEDIAPAWHGIGVRIEDDVLVTPAGHEVLTSAVPKRVDEIESLRRVA
jgi:Xaa-Pro aminopeptidase